MIEVHVFRSAWGIPNPSPFCTKLITWLRIAGIEHRVVEQAFTRGAPKGKLPFAIIDGQKLGDSQFIIESLIAKHGDAVDGHLTAEQKATSRAVREMLEEHFYFTSVYFRFIDDGGWAAVVDTFLSDAPAAMRPLISKLIRRDVAKNLRIQGIGRHDAADIARVAIADLEAFVTLLGDKPFFFGERPTLLDATAYGFVSNLLESPSASPVAAWARSNARLKAYNSRIKSMYFAELPAA